MENKFSCLLFIATRIIPESLWNSPLTAGAAVLLAWVASPAATLVVTWTCVEPTATLRKYWKPKHWQVILQLSSVFFRPTRYVCLFSCFWDNGRIIDGVPSIHLQLYSSYREDLGVFLYYYFFFPCRSVKGFKLHWQKCQNESVLFSSHLKLLALLAGCIFSVCISW